MNQCIQPSPPQTKLWADIGILRPCSQFLIASAVELLLAGVPIERVSILLGHQSVRVTDGRNWTLTEKHYNPWVRSRQEQLEADVARAWLRDPVLVQKIPGTKRVQIGKERVN